MVTNRNNVLDVLSGIFILRMVYTHTCMYAGLDDHTVLFDITGMFSDSQRILSLHNN